jgi:hypothetical protein
LKAINIISGGSAGIYALAHCAIFTHPPAARRASRRQSWATLAELCIGAAIAYALLHGAFKQKVE